MNSVRLYFFVGLLPVSSHLIDDLRNASIRTVNLIDSADRCPGGMACSSHESNLMPNPLPPETIVIVIVIVIDLPSLSSCEQLGDFSAPDPKTPTPKRRSRSFCGARAGWQSTE